MGKDEKNIFQKDIEVPPIVMEKAEAAFLAIKEEGWDIMKEKKSVRTGRVWKAAAAAAACAAVLVAAGVAGKGMLNGGENVSQAEGDVFAEQDQAFPIAANDVKAAGDEDAAKASDFSLTVYGQETRLAGGQDGSLAFTDIGCGEGGYTGMLFQVQGDDIADVRISVDRGELYTATEEAIAEDVFYELAAQGLPDEDGDPNTHTVYKLIGEPDFEEKDEQAPPLEVIGYHCTKSGAQVEGAYDGELYYGFYIPDDVTSAKEDLAEAYHEQLGVFDGGTLTVTITRGDGSSMSKDYALSTAKLALDENRNVTQQEWIEGGEGFVYGILAKEK
ncbi:hypothetical protein AALB53_02075 [Lachnospiraceae bacterium 47-T17]